MRHPFCAVLVLISFALEMASCESWKWNQKSEGEEVIMPLQTGSTIQRRVVVPGASEESPKKKKPKEKKDSEKKKEEAKKPDETKKKDSKKTTPTPTPARPKHQPEPEPEETPSAPDRLR